MGRSQAVYKIHDLVEEEIGTSLIFIFHGLLALLLLYSPNPYPTLEFAWSFLPRFLPCSAQTSALLKVPVPLNPALVLSQDCRLLWILLRSDLLFPKIVGCLDPPLCMCVQSHRRILALGLIERV